MSANFIDTEDSLCVLLDSIQRLPPAKSLIFIDLEGVDLSRHGSIAVMQMLIPPGATVHLIDVHVLGRQAFDTPGTSGLTIRTVLQSEQYAKVFFDVRNDSDALYAHFEIDLRGIIDLQLLEFATRPFAGRLVNGLARCISNDARLDWKKQNEWQRIKLAGQRLFAPEKGGSYDVFLTRPLPDELVQYCVQDVLILPQLLRKYGGRLERKAAEGMHEETTRRIVLSQSPNFNGKGRHMALGPTLKKSGQNANNIPFPTNLICSADLAGLCALDEVKTMSATTPSDEAAKVFRQQVPAESPMDGEPPSAGMNTLSIRTGDNEGESAAMHSHTRRHVGEDSAMKSSSSTDVLGIFDGRKESADNPSGDEADHSDQDPVEDLPDDRDNESLSSHGNDSEKDYTACSADDCGYCGHCSY